MAEVADPRLLFGAAVRGIGGLLVLEETCPSYLLASSVREVQGLVVAWRRSLATHDQGVEEEIWHDELPVRWMMRHALQTLILADGDSENRPYIVGKRLRAVEATLEALNRRLTQGEPRDQAS